MTQQQPQPKVNWRVRAYLIATGAGTLIGLISGYMYTRSAEEYAERNDGNPPKPATIEIVTLLIAAVTAVRQIAELGKPNKPSK
jgi:hypothetical protein